MQNAARNNSVCRDAMAIDVPSDSSAVVIVVALVVTPLTADSFIESVGALTSVSTVDDTEMISVPGTVVTWRLDKDALYDCGGRRDATANVMAVMLSEAAGVGANSSTMATGISNFEFVALSSLREESVLCSCSAFSSLSMRLSERSCALQTRKPSDHE